MHSREFKIVEGNIEHNTFDMFSALERCRPTSEIKPNKKLILNHMGTLQEQFSLYFIYVDISKCEWVRNTFPSNNVSGLMICEHEQLINIPCDCFLKNVFDANRLPQFRLLVKNDYPSFSDNAIKVLLPYVTLYLCENRLSAVAVMKRKQRSQLIIE